MRKFILFALLCLPLWCCSFFRHKTNSYPKGVIFPLEREGEVRYRGEVIDHIEKKGNTLYLSTTKGFVYGIDGEKRRVIWRFRAKDSLVSPPFLGEKGVFVYDRNSVLYCLDRGGKLRWNRKIEERITSGVRESLGVVYFGTEKGILLALDEEKGQELWRFQAGGPIHSTPILAEGMVVFGCDDAHLYFLTERGSLLDKFASRGRIGSSPLADGKFLYFGSDDHFFYCLDLPKRRERWKTKVGCKVLGSPLTDEKRVVFLCLNGILYCLDKKNGTILWWRAVPSRSYYQLNRAGEKILVTSLSSLLVSFDLQTGEKVGEFDSGQEIQSNPLWFEPYVLVNLYNPDKERGRLLYLKKKVEVTLEASKKSPQKLGEELGFTALTHGFFKPEFEFILSRLARVELHPTSFSLHMAWKKQVVQEKSRQKSWQWLAEIPGFYLVKVKAEDEKERAEVVVPFVIEKEKAQVSVLSSKSSPQIVDNEIEFQAASRGLQKPAYEFFLSRLIRVDFRVHLFQIRTEWEKQLVQEKSEKSIWSWKAEKPGLYWVGATASDGMEDVESMIPFIIERESDRGIRSLMLFFIRWIDIFLFP